MAFNIWERWPWTSFQNLNLDWLMKAVKEAVTKADEAATSVGQFDTRITQNTDAIEQLGTDLETISSPVKVFVNSNLEAHYRGSHITGSQLLSMVGQHGDLPYVEYNNEVYMLDSVSNAGDMRFSMTHITTLDDVIIQHIMIPAQSYNAAYSITNVSSGGSGSSNVFAVTVTGQGGGYVSDHTYAEIYSQMQAGRIPVLLVGLGSNPTTYEVCGMGETGTHTINGQSVACIRFSDPTWMVTATNDVAVWTIDANNNVDHIVALKQLADIQNIADIVNDGVSTNALLKTTQTLTAAEQAQVKQNIGITGNPLVVTVENPSSGNSNFTVDKTAAEIRANLYNLRLRYGLNEGVDINSYEVFGSPPLHDIRFTVTDPNTSSVSYVEFILTIFREGFIPQDPADDVVEVTRNLYTHNIGGGSLPDTTNAAAGDVLQLDSNKNVVWADGNKPREVIAASSASIPPLSPNTLYVYTGDAAALNITLAAPANNNVENEYHFIFNSGSTPTTLTLPNTIRQPDGFTVEANHVYEVSILEGNMTAQGWEVTP